VGGRGPNHRYALRTSYPLGHPRRVRVRATEVGKGRSAKLSREATEALTSHGKRQLEEQTGEAEERFTGLVFTTTNGTPYTRTNLPSQGFRFLLKRAGLPAATRFHDLRHTCATKLLKMGQHPRYVQELLGHASIRITLGTCSDVIEGMGDGLADAMDDAL
jgi:integrase